MEVCTADHVIGAANAHRDLGRASVPLHAAGEGCWKRHDERRVSVEQTSSETPLALRKSLMWDRGKEMASHQQFTIATDVQVYFCDPQSPWQRGTNENTNRLLRQYFPKGTYLSIHSQAALNKIALQMNQQPRKTLSFYAS